MLNRVFIIMVMSFSVLSVSSQTIQKLTITDNLSSSSKFGYGKPKPASAKDHFELIEDKGTQVLFYAEMAQEDALPESYRLNFTAYLLDSGKEIWVDERILEVKRVSGYALTAFNFFDPGNYKVVISPNDNKEIILAEDTFQISRK